MTAPAYQNKSSTGEIFATDFTPLVPSGTASGDLLVACCWNASESIATAPAGWTQALTVSNASNMHLDVYWKIATATESSPTFSGTSDSYGEVIVYRVSGTDSSTPIDVTGTYTGTLDAPSVTTTVDDCLVLHLFGTASSSGTQILAPVGDTALDEPSNFYCGLSSGYTTQNSAGATGPAAFDDALTTSDQVTATVAIAPPSTTAPINLNDVLQLQWPGTLTAAVGGDPVREDTGAGTVTSTGSSGPGVWFLNHYQSGGQTGATWLRNGTSSPLNLTAPFTVALWEKCSGGPTHAKTWLKLTGSGADAIEVSQAADANPATIPHKLRVAGVEQASDQRGANNYNPTIWTLVVVRADGAGNIEMRQNDAAFDAGTHTASHEYDELQVAHITTDGMAWYVDEVAVWDRTLTDAEVDHLWNAGVGQSYELGNYGPGSVEPLALSVDDATPRIIPGAESIVLSAEPLAVDLADADALTLHVTARLPGVLQPAVAINLPNPGVLFGNPQEVEALTLQPVVLGPELPEAIAALGLQVDSLPPALPSVNGLALRTDSLTGGLQLQPLTLTAESLFGGLSHSETLTLGVADHLIGPNELQPAETLTLRVDASLNPRVLPLVETLSLATHSLPGVFVTPVVTLAADSLSDVPLLTMTPRLVLRADRFITHSFERVNLIGLRSRRARLQSLSVTN